MKIPGLMAFCANSYGLPLAHYILPVVVLRCALSSGKLNPIWFLHSEACNEISVKILYIAGFVQCMQGQ